MSPSFFGGEQKHSHFPKFKSEKVKILTSPSIFADVGTKITVMENILHAFSLTLKQNFIQSFYLRRPNGRRLVGLSLTVESDFRRRTGRECTLV